MNRKFLFLTTALISCLTVSHARAGFEWNPPSAKAPVAESRRPEAKAIVIALRRMIRTLIFDNP